MNVSRHFSHQVLEYVRGSDPAAITALQREVVDRHVTYVHALRCMLRRQDPFADANVQRLSSEADRAAVRDSTNVPAALLELNRRRMVDAADSGWLGEERLRAMDASFAEMLAVQGGCERILLTPIPVTYVYFASRIVMWYGALLPFGMVGELGLLTLLVAPLVSMVFVLIDETGRLIQEPFSTGVFGLPLSALSTTIERNVREFVVPREQLPDAAQPVGPKRELLM